MRILLLNPPTPDNKAFIREGRCNQEKGVWTTLWPPITLATAGAMLEERGHKVEILDCAAQGIDLAGLLGRIEQKRYALVTWSTATPSIKSDLALANDIKEIESGVRTAAIGTHVTALATECLGATHGLDYVIRGEPEESIVALVEGLGNGVPLKNVKGVSYKDQRGQVFHNPPRPFIQDLDSLPFPAWHLIDIDKYRLPLRNERFLMLSPVRGCPYPCTFCTAQTYYGKRLRRKSVPRTVEEIEYLVGRFGIKQFFIWADTFTADQDYVIRFCQAIQARDLKIGWTCNSRVDTVDRPLLEAMSGAGCWMISYGIESGSQRVLDTTKKKTTTHQSRAAVRMAKEAGIKVAGHFVLGLPGDSEETLKETIDFSLHLDIDIAQFYCAVPFPGSRLYELAKEGGWIVGKEFEEFRQDNAVMNLPGLRPSTLNSYRRRGFRRFYMNPARFFRMLPMMKATGIWDAIKGGLRFIRWAG